MSSSGPYQSRFLNLIVQQSRRLRDRSVQTFRTIRMGALWGAQILLYPIYAAVQASRLVGKQIKQAVRQAIPQLRAATQPLQPIADTSPQATLPSSDVLLHKVLRVAQTFALPGIVQQASPASSPSSLLPAAPTPKFILQTSNADSSDLKAIGTNISPTSLPQIRGIATQLEDRTLVLVTTVNQILDVLTAEQQLRLKQQIVWELANYYYDQRHLHLLQKPFSRQLPPIVDREYLLPPVRAFWQFMGWMQRSPVAIATNLFQEATLLLASQQVQSSRPTPKPHWLQTPLLPPLRGTLYPGRTRYQKGTPWQQLFGKGQSLTHPTPLPDQWREPADLGSLQAKRSVETQERSPTSSQWPPALPPSSTALTTTHRLLSLRDGVANILRSLGLGKATRSSPPSLPLEKTAEDNSPSGLSLHPIASWLRSRQFPLVYPRPQESLPDQALQPELLKSDALRESTSQDGVLQPIPTQPNDLASHRRNQYSEPKLNNLYLEEGNIVEPRATNGEQLPEMLPSPSEDSAIAPSDATANSLGHSDAKTIDIQATLVGYVKHPLEQLLGWVDLAMLWLEEHTLQLWRWLQGRQ